MMIFADNWRMSSTTFFSVNLLVVLTATIILVDCMASACDIEAARQSSAARPGGWSGVAVDDSSVVQLKETVVNDASVAKAHDVVESYQQVDHVTLRHAHCSHAFRRSTVNSPEVEEYSPNSTWLYSTRLDSTRSTC